jgi:hypothetical protein
MFPDYRLGLSEMTFPLPLFVSARDIAKSEKTLLAYGSIRIPRTALSTI